MFAPSSSGGAEKPRWSCIAGRSDELPIDGFPLQRTIVADPRRGRLDLVNTGERVLLVWTDRRSKSKRPELEIEMHPGAQELVKVDTGVESDRVYCLKFADDDSTRHFFWLQKGDASNDAKEIAAFNNSIAEAPQRAGDDDDELSAIMGNILAEASASSTQQGSASDLSASDLTSILRGMGYTTSTTRPEDEDVPMATVTEEEDSTAEGEDADGEAQKPKKEEDDDMYE